MMEWLGVPEAITVNGARALFFPAIGAAASMMPRIREWAKTAPPLGLSKVQVALVWIAVVAVIFVALALVGWFSS
jgi:hypothetical protein